MEPQDIDLEKLWKEILETTKVSVSTPVFNTWFSGTHLVGLKHNEKRFEAEVGCNSVFIRDQIEKRYYGLLQDILSKNLDRPCDLTLVIKENPKSKTSDVNTPLFEHKNTDNYDVDNIARAVGLRPGFTFENFAVSSSNQMAYAAAEAVGDNLGRAYNPLFIWGGVGVGKTHLMHAVGYKSIEKKYNLNIICCTGEKFTNDIVEGIRNKTTPGVRQKYRKLDALLVDDIQFIAGKEGVQEEFFHTFNDLVPSGSQVILTSDKPPSEISKLEERLKSRFEAGLITDIAPPDFELRCAIIQIKSKERGMEIPMDMVQVIGGNIETARQIEGFLVKLSSEIMTNKVEITEELIQSLVGKGVGANRTKIKANPDEVISAVSKYFSLGKRNLLGDSRSRPNARPRQILMYLLRIDLGLPLVEVGRVVGGRDHTTVMHAVKKITNLASNTVQVREDIMGIKNML